MTDAHAEYWREAVMMAFEDSGLWDAIKDIPMDKLMEVGATLSVSAEHQGEAFYTPPASDRINSIEREWKAKFERLQAEHDSYVETAGKTIGRILRQDSGDHVFMSANGDVYRSGGRTEQIA